MSEPKKKFLLSISEWGILTGIFLVVTLCLFNLLTVIILLWMAWTIFRSTFLQRELQYIPYEKIVELTKGNKKKDITEELKDLYLSANGVYPDGRIIAHCKRALWSCAFITNPHTRIGFRLWIAYALVEVVHISAPDSLAILFFLGPLAIGGLCKVFQGIMDIV